MRLQPVRWTEQGLEMLDQRILPNREDWILLTTWQEVAESIRNMTVRGAPAIGISAAYGMALAALSGANIDEAKNGLAASRPTAVNLFWALDRIASLPNFEFETVIAEAKRIDDEDYAMNQRIGELGAELIQPRSQILTICNTGAIATSGHGTALGIIRTAFAQGKVEHVYSCETRPRQQGLRLTAWELQKEGIPFHSIVDSAAASLFNMGKVDAVIAGADRIAANGDTANKVGTYMLAVLAKFHDVPFYIAAPSSTLDPSTATGDGIPIEERNAEEITHIEGVPVGPEGCPVWNPGFDVTPGELITAIITERAVFRGPYSFSLAGANS